MKFWTYLMCGFWLFQGSAVGQSPAQKSLDGNPSSDYSSWRVPASAASLKNPFQGQLEHAKGGKKIFDRYCVSCHGKEGEGTKKIMGVRSSRVLEAPAGMLFWFIKNGNSRAGMPGWARLPDQQIWQLVTFLQAPGEESDIK